MTRQPGALIQEHSSAALRHSTSSAATHTTSSSSVSHSSPLTPWSRGLPITPDSPTELSDHIDVPSDYHAEWRRKTDEALAQRPVHIKLGPEEAGRYLLVTLAWTRVLT